MPVQHYPGRHASRPFDTSRGAKQLLIGERAYAYGHENSILLEKANPRCPNSI